MKLHIYSKHTENLVGWTETERADLPQHGGWEYSREFDDQEGLEMHSLSNVLAKALTFTQAEGFDVTDGDGYLRVHLGNGVEGDGFMSEEAEARAFRAVSTLLAKMFR